MKDLKSIKSSLKFKMPKITVKKEDDKKLDTIDKINENVKKEVGETLKKIRENEKQFKKQLATETDSGFYFQIVFKDAREMRQFLAEKKIKLEYDNFVFYEDIRDKFR